MLTDKQFKELRAKIKASFKKYARLSPANIKGILPIKDLQGKLYEAFILSRIIEELVKKEGCLIKLVRSGLYTFKQKGSPINRDYPFFEIFKSGVLFGELFTDTEFLSLSYFLQPGKPESNSDYHELDIVLLKPGCTDKSRPSHEKVMIGVECKATTFEKSTFREVLGFRRELAYLQDIQKTNFDYWPINYVPSDPASVHMCYSTDPAILKYKKNGEIFGIVIENVPF